MQAILGLLYSVIFICYVFAIVFVIFHLLRYSLNQHYGRIGALVFIAVAAILLITNALLFLNLPLDEILSTSFQTL